MPTGLAERLRDAARARGIAVEPDVVAALADLVRLTVRALGLERAPIALAPGAAAAAGAPAAAGALAVELCIGEGLRSGVRPDERRAFVARFGPDAAAALQDESDPEPALSAFGLSAPRPLALALLDLIVAVAADGEPDPVRLRGRLPELHEAARELGFDLLVLRALIERRAPSLISFALPLGPDVERLLIGRGAGCDLWLPCPQVAPQHMELVQINGAWRAADLGSGRPTLVQGSPIRSAPIAPGGALGVGPWRLQLDEGPAGAPQLEVDGRRPLSALIVRGLRRKIGDVSLLDDVSFTVFSGEVVALVGPSGAGKTTLLHAISGLAPADSGEVLLDGQPFHARLEADRSLIGVVPQDDLVLAELTVEESLFASGRLRFPPQVTDAEVQAEVDRVLGELDIAHIRRSRIGDALRRGISGGQRKRVNLGQELLTRSTRVLFLDEPTSGLDPRASQDIVRVIRQIADRGRIVFLVTHDLTPEVMAMVDHLLVLAKGGRLAWFGPPADGARAFGVNTPDAVFNRFLDHPPEVWGQRYRASEAARVYVAGREALVPQLAAADAPAAPAPRRSALGQLRTLVRRYAKVRARDRTSVAVLAVQPAFLGLVMAVVFPAPTTPFLFMLTLACLWFGMSASVRELISDRVVWHREHRVGVGVFPYISSKILVLGGAVGAQCALLASVLYGVLGLGEYGFHLGLLALVSTLTGLLGVAIGLLVSALWTSSEAAVGTLPLLLIPQITFSSIMVSVRDMRPLAKAATWLTFQRYSFDAVIKTGERVAVPTHRSGEWEAQPINGSLWKLGLKFSDSAEDRGFSLPQLLLILSASAAVGFALAAWQVRRRARA